MNKKLKITALSIIISSFLSSNSFAAIQGYNEAEKDEKESSSFLFFKGYKTEEQKNKEKESLEEKRQEISVEREIVESKSETNNNPDLIKDDINNEISVENEVVVNINNVTIQKPIDNVNNIKMLKPTTVRHVINSNETLWSLAVKYYNDGDLWTKILTDNPSIKEPSKLHKGQEIIIKDINKNFKEKKYSRLKINPYLLEHILHDVIVLNSNHNISSKIITSENQQKLIKLTDKFYVPKTNIKDKKVYNVYRYNKNIEGLGQEYIQVGEAIQVSYIDELAVMKTVKVKDYLLKDDILIEKTFDIKESFNRINHEENFNKGEILSIVNNKKEATLFDLLIVNLTNKEVETGSVLSVYSKPTKIIDKDSGIESIIPSKEIAKLIVIKAEEDFSLTIVGKSMNEIKVGDTIR
tara:strand:+ start:8041 stop:9270 length:1230 start_codon:yes stop_codon:yes gene_type:complete